MRLSLAELNMAKDHRRFKQDLRILRVFLVMHDFDSIILRHLKFILEILVLWSLEGTQLSSDNIPYHECRHWRMHGRFQFQRCQAGCVAIAEVEHMVGSEAGYLNKNNLIRHQTKYFFFYNDDLVQSNIYGIE